MLRVLSWHVLAVHDVNLWGEAEDVLSASDAWNSRASAKRAPGLASGERTDCFARLRGEDQAVSSMVVHLGWWASRITSKPSVSP